MRKILLGFLGPTLLALGMCACGGRSSPNRISSLLVIRDKRHSPHLVMPWRAKRSRRAMRRGISSALARWSAMTMSCGACPRWSTAARQSPLDRAKRNVRSGQLTLDRGRRLALWVRGAAL
jgi:hypothetical protein